MKEIKLLNLTISNWRGQNHDIDFKDNTFISAKNGAGKSTLLHAWLWALTGYTEVGLPKNTNLFDNREVLSEHTPWASVVATMEIDGYKYVVERKSKPKFTRSKGSLEFTKGSSDLYEYYIDNIEVGASGITNFVEGTIGVPCDMLVYCLSGDFFSYLASEEKNKARNILCSIAGEVSAEDFKGDYSSIAELLERYSASDIIEMSRKKKKPLEDRQNAIPNEIDIKEERLSVLKAMDFSYYENAIKDTKERIEAIDGLLLGNADAIKPIIDHNREIENNLSNLRLSLSNGRIAHREKQNERTSEIRAKIEEIKRYNEAIERENEKIKKEWMRSAIEGELLVNEMKALEESLNMLRNKKNEVKDRIFTEDHCPYCGAELDPLEIEKKRDDFNNRKQMDLNAIVAEGKATKEKLERKQKEYAELAGRNESGPKLLEKSSTTDFEEALKRLEATFVPYEDTVEHDEIYAKIKACEREIKEIPSNDNEALTSEKKALIEQLSEFSKKLGLKDEIEKVENDILELKKELRSVANSIAELEKNIFTAKAYEQEKHEIVSFRINGKMKKARFEMWSKQKNGELVADLLLTNECGTRFSTTNFANRIELMLDLQELFCKTFGVNMPRFIDESAVFSPSNLPVFEDSQAIYLFASDEPTLCVK